MNKYDTATDLSLFGSKMNNLSEESRQATPSSHNHMGVAYLEPPSRESQSAAGSKETLNVAYPDNTRPGSGYGSAHSLDPESSGKKTPAPLRNVAGFDSLVAVFGEDKKQRTLKLPHGGSLLSIFYGIVVIILGIAFPTKEALHGVWLKDYIAAVYQVYMYGMGFIFLVGMEIYLVCVDKRQRKRSSTASSPTSPISNQASRANTSMDPGFVNIGFEPDDKSRRAPQRPRPSTVRELRYSNRSSAAFSDSTVYEDTDVGRGQLEHGRETTLYIRIVVIVLCLAAMVYDGLLVKQLHEGLSPSACGTVLISWPRYVHIAFLLIQCYFLFKHSQMIVLPNRAIFRLGFVHVLATNISELFRAFVTQSFNGNLYHQNASLFDTGQNTSITVMQCDYEKDIMYRAAPYLYPCVIEYNFLAAALVYFMFSSLDDGNLYYSPQPNITKSHTEINCQRTHKGLFFGIVLLAATAVSVILFFSYMQVNDKSDVSLFIYQISDIGLHCVLIAAIIIAWIQTGKLSFVAQLDLAFEDGVLLIAMSLGILFSVLQLMPTVTDMIDGNTDLTNILSLTGSLIMMVTGVFQTSFMIDLSCRYLTLDAEWEGKPGRGSVMFLVLTNLALWLLKTFQIRALELQLGSQEATYGYLPWQLMVNGFVPFMIYYYLFSSACLARTWHQTYTDSSVSVKFDAQYSPRHEKYSTPAKEFEFVRQRKVNRALKMDLDTIVSPVSDV